MQNFLNQEKPSSAIKDEISSVQETLILAICCACGVSLLSTILAANLPLWLQMALGCTLIAVTIVMLFLGRFKKVQKTATYKSAVAVDLYTGDVWNIPEYRFSSDATRLLRACFIEREELRVEWVRTVEKLSSQHDELFEPYFFLPRELTEHLVFSCLSTTISDELLKSNFKIKNLSEYDKEEVHSISRNNRVTEIITSPIENRRGFENIPLTEGNGKLFQATTAEGYHYERLSFLVPNGCKVFRDTDGTILIRSRFIEVRVIVGEVTVSNVSRRFLNHYVGIAAHRTDLVFTEFQIQLNFRRRFTRTKTAQLQLDWAEQLFGSLERDVSFDHWLNSIGWKQREAWLHLLGQENPRPHPYNRLEPESPWQHPRNSMDYCLFRMAPELGDMEEPSPVSNKQLSLPEVTHTGKLNRPFSDLEELKHAAQEARGLNWIKDLELTDDSEQSTTELLLILQGLLWVSSQIVEDELNGEFRDLQRELTLGINPEELFEKSIFFRFLPTEFYTEYDEEFFNCITDETKRIVQIFATTWTYPENIAQALILDHIISEIECLTETYDLDIDLTLVEWLREILFLDRD